MGAALGTWLWATLAVLVMVAVTAVMGKWLLRRVGSRPGPVQQVGQWRVAPDASVRAVQVLDRVHVIYERGREASLLETRDAEQFAADLASPTAASANSSARPRARVAQA